MSASSSWLSGSSAAPAADGLRSGLPQPDVSMREPQPQQRFFYRLTQGIRITVRPEYLAGQSDPERRRFVFAYHVRIENVGKQSAQLLSRLWRIHDAIGEDI